MGAKLGLLCARPDGAIAPSGNVNVGINKTEQPTKSVLMSGRSKPVEMVNQIKLIVSIDCREVNIIFVSGPQLRYELNMLPTSLSHISKR